jgi:hypothetical protein
MLTAFLTWAATDRELTKDERIEVLNEELDGYRYLRGYNRPVRMMRIKLVLAFRTMKKSGQAMRTAMYGNRVYMAGLR